MLDSPNNNEFMQLMQREVDIINTDNTVFDNPNELNLNMINGSNNNNNKEQNKVFKDPSGQNNGISNFREKASNNEDSSKSKVDLAERMNVLESNYEQMEKRITAIEDKQKKFQEIWDFKKRIEVIEKTLADLKKEKNEKMREDGKNRGHVQSGNKAVDAHEDKSQNEVLNDAIKNLKSKLEYRNSMIKNLSKTQKIE